MLALPPGLPLGCVGPGLRARSSSISYVDATSPPSSRHSQRWTRPGQAPQTSEMRRLAACTIRSHQPFTFRCSAVAAGKTQAKMTASGRRAAEASKANGSDAAVVSMLLPFAQPLPSIAYAFPLAGRLEPDSLRSRRAKGKMQGSQAR